MVLRHSLLWFSNNQQAQGLATHSSVGRKLARRFVAGEKLDEAVSAVRELNRKGFTASLDHLGENVADLDQALRATDDYVGILHRIQSEQLNANISVKLTQVGLAIDEGRALENLQRILGEAERLHNTVTVDMESSAYTERAINLVLAARQERANVGVAVQAYLYRSRADVEKLNQARVCGIRLCKGAYDEPPSVAFPHKQEVDDSYLQILVLLLKSGCYPAIATHDPRIIDAATRLVSQHELTNKDFEFQMLYGIRRDLQERLIRAGYALRIYVPYGTEWYPYLIRRLAERPANLLFFTRSLLSEALPGRRRE